MDSREPLKLPFIEFLEDTPMTETEVLAISNQLPEELQEIIRHSIGAVLSGASQEIAEEGVRQEFVRALIARAAILTATGICTAMSRSLDQAEMLERIYLSQ